ncbi:nucleoside hydrolase [bacterium]|nr:nucleoside hydrolase [bacterium]
MPKKVMIDADPGISDALAIAMALHDPELDVVALTAVGGRVSATQAARNLFTLLEALDPPKFPRLGVADGPEVVADPVLFMAESTEDLEIDRRLHGPQGLGDWPVGDADLHHPRSAAKLMIEMTREYPGEVTLITLGPLTTVALAIELDPEFPMRLGGLVSMAGSLGPGDITPSTEFNVGYHPTSARHVLRFPSTKTLVPLDLARKVVLTFDRVQQIPFNDDCIAGHFLRSILGYALRSHHEALGMEGLHLNDLMAIAAVSQAHLFHRENMAVEVETEGRITRGMTVFDRRSRPRWRSNIEVLTDVDGVGLLDYVTRTLPAT